MLTKCSDFYPSSSETPDFLVGLLTGENCRQEYLPYQFVDSVDAEVERLLRCFGTDDVLKTFDHYAKVALTPHARSKISKADILRSLGLTVKGGVNFANLVRDHLNILRDRLVFAPDNEKRLAIIRRQMVSAVTLAFSGSVKSSFGKAYSDLYFGGLMTLFGKNICKDANAFYESPNDDFVLSHKNKAISTREIDGSVYLGEKLVICEITFTNSTNSDVISDKMTRHVSSGRQYERILFVDQLTGSQRVESEGKPVTFEIRGNDMPYLFNKKYGLTTFSDDPKQRKDFYRQTFCANMEKLETAFPLRK